MGQTKLLLLAYPVGSQEYGELFILLLFPNMQWKYGTKPFQSSPANLAQEIGSPVLLKRNFNQSNVAGSECFCYKVFRHGFSLCVALFFLPLLYRLPTFQEVRAGVNSYMEFPSQEGGGGWVTPPQCSLMYNTELFHSYRLALENNVFLKCTRSDASPGTMFIQCFAVSGTICFCSGTIMWFKRSSRSSPPVRTRNWLLTSVRSTSSTTTGGSSSSTLSRS